MACVTGLYATADAEDVLDRILLSGCAEYMAFLDDWHIRDRDLAFTGDAEYMRIFCEILDVPARIVMVIVVVRLVVTRCLRLVRRLWLVRCFWLVWRFRLVRRLRSFRRLWLVWRLWSFRRLRSFGVSGVLGKVG